MSTAPQRLALLKGGFSTEREVSLRTGQAVAAALREVGYDVVEIVVEDEHFIVPPETELVFIALHGTFGEDGQVQELLSARGLPFTGANAAVSRLAFDKQATKVKFLEQAVPTPPGQLVHSRAEVTLPLPLFIKPNAQGSSVGSRAVETPAELEAALADALRFGSGALVERLVRGKELTVGILGDSALPIVEIRPHDGFYDYQNKYTSGRTDYFCPAPLSAAQTAQIQHLALAAHRAIGNPVYSRVDFMLDRVDEVAYCLEVNTIPGMTATSLLPKAAAAAGLPFPELCRKIVELSWVYHYPELAR